MSVIEHKGWQIESRSYQTETERWCPRALVSVFERGRPCTHDVRALLSVTFDTARDADDFSIKMAKMWIEEREYRPAWQSSTRPGPRRLDVHESTEGAKGRRSTGATRRGTRGAGRKLDHFAGRVLLLMPRLTRLLLFGGETSRRPLGAPVLAPVPVRARRRR